VRKLLSALGAVVLTAGSWSALAAEPNFPITAQQREAGGDMDRAWPLYRRAADLDQQRFRADSRVRGLQEKIASDSGDGVALIDADRWLHELNPGFTNDRESLSFPLFAFDDFLREAERAADTVLGFAEKPWTWDRDFLEIARTSTITTDATAEGDGIVLDTVNEPFFFSFEAPQTGLYEVTLRARTFDGEPLSGLGLFLDGAPVQEWVIEGADTRAYRTRLNVTAGAHTLNFGYTPALAPLIQPRHPAQSVPVNLARQLPKRPLRKMALPAHLKDNREAFEAFRRMNNVIAAYMLTQDLAQMLLDRGETDYEEHELEKSHPGVLQNQATSKFQTNKAAFNLSGGKVAVLLGIPQTKLEQRIKKELGFSHEAYVATIKRYNEAFAKKHPERVRKKAGKLALTRLTLQSHSVAAQDRKSVV
jgi:hypothetical protein